MSEPRPRCPNGTKYNKTTKLCEENNSSVSLRKTKRSPPRASARASSSSASSASYASSASASQRVESLISHPNEKTYRLLISVDVYNRALWPNDKICYFRTTGTSNQGHEIFAGSWFPIVGIKDNSSMTGFLKDKTDGFLIKMGLVVNENEQISDIDRPKWFMDLLSDYPIVLEPEEIDLFDETEKINDPPCITIDTFFKKKIYRRDDKNIIMLKEYEMLTRKIDDIITNTFEYFFNYFLYEWQIMLSLRIGGGYWDYNPLLKAYVSAKLRDFDLVKIPHIDKKLKKAKTQEKLGQIYDETHDHNQLDTTNTCINFSKTAGTQLTVNQIKELKEIEKRNRTIIPSKGFSFVLYNTFITKYKMVIMSHKQKYDTQNSAKLLTKPK